MIASFGSGATRQQLADQHDTSVNGIERLFWERGVRRWTLQRRDEGANTPGRLLGLRLIC